MPGRPMLRSPRRRGVAGDPLTPAVASTSVAQVSGRAVVPTGAHPSVATRSAGFEPVGAWS
jgi:hypothetical protein